MTIIREGIPEKTKQPEPFADRFFVCRRCNCLWQADKGEYKIEKCTHGEWLPCMPCPNCGASTFGCLNTAYI